MTLLGPERLALRPPRGIRLEVTFRELVRWVEHPIVTADPASAGAFVLASLRDGIRSSDHVESVSALALEHDAGTMTAADRTRAIATVSPHRLFDGVEPAGRALLAGAPGRLAGDDARGARTGLEPVRACGRTRHEGRRRHARIPAGFGRCRPFRPAQRTSCWLERARRSTSIGFWR